MNIQENISLKPYNTFGIDVIAKRFIEVDFVYELQQLFNKEKDVFFIGGGSNMLLTSDIDKIVVHNNIKGISIDKEFGNDVYLTVNAGENWHDFVLWTIRQGYGGLENLSYIPGNVGSCPIQNIGAYGVEVKDLITRVEVIEIETQKTVSFTNLECDFGYRNSVFKNEYKGKYCIISVSFKLTRNEHKLNTSYGAIDKELISKGVTNPTLKDVSDAVIAIRKSKLPDPKEIGNSGSFFKNPIISMDLFCNLQKDYENMPFYEVSDTEVKVPAGWLIEQCGFKGKRFGNCGVHDKQALVLVNYGGATGLEVYELAQTIQKTVKDKFGILLDIEVNII